VKVLKKSYAKLALITLFAPSLINSQVTFAEEIATSSENVMQTTKSNTEQLETDKNSKAIINQEGNKVNEHSLTNKTNDLEKSESVDESIDENTINSDSFDSNKADKNQNISETISNSSSLDPKKKNDETPNSENEQIEESTKNTEEESMDSTDENSDAIKENDSASEIPEKSGTNSEASQVKNSTRVAKTYDWAGLTVTLDDEGTLHVPAGTAETIPSDYLLTPETKKVIFEGPLTIIGSMERMFWQIGGNLTSIENLDYIDTSNVTTMSRAFISCGNIEELDLSSWDTSKVKYFSKMFQGCYSLKSINLSNINTSNAVRMDEMFSATGLEKLDLSSFDTSNVEDMSNMFMGSDSLTTLNLSNFNTSKVFTMSDMFSMCSNLESLDISSFDTTNVKYWKSNRSGFLAACYQLKVLKLGEKFNIGELDNTSIGLPEHEASELYDSTWQNIGSGTLDNPQGENIWSSSELIEQYNGMTDSDTYVWTPSDSNKTAVTVKDSTLTVGDKWNPSDNFVSATDKDGNPVDFSEVTVTGNVDTSKAGEYKVTYSYGGITKEATITVKNAASEDQTTITTKDSTLTVGDKWNPSDNFVSATDKDGNPVDISEVTVSGSVDTSKAGEYRVTYSYGGVTKEATITVKEATTDQTTTKTADSTVTAGNSGKSDKTLPKTGEKSSLIPVGIGFSLIALVSYLFGRKK
jgi:LPXTG-motif cell wall-anchored protein